MIAHPLDAVRAALPQEYEITGFLSRGGQAAVFDGSYSGSRSAIKLFAPIDPRRIEREIAALKAIDCDYLVKVRASTVIDLQGQRLPVIAYEFLEDGDLGDLLLPGPRPTWLTLRGIALHVSTGIEALWGRRIVHRDIKPANIVRSGARNVLADVGIARHVDLPTLTVQGGWVGTLGFMSPEQARGVQNLSSSADVFSLGVTLYALAAGVHPFGGQQAAIGILTPTPLAVYRRDLPQPFCTLVDAMLQVVPHRRPTHLVDRLRQL